MLRWVNTLLEKVKNALHGTHHAIKGKYLKRFSHTGLACDRLVG